MWRWVFSFRLLSYGSSHQVYLYWRKWIELILFTSRVIKKQDMLRKWRSSFTESRWNTSNIDFKRKLVGLCAVFVLIIIMA